MENTGNQLKKRARITGLLFLLWILTGFYDMFFVASKIFVKDNHAATAQNILDHELLFRSGIFSDLITTTLWIFLVMSFYQLFKSVHERHTRLLVALVLVQVPVAFINGAFSVAALLTLKGKVLASFDLTQRQDFAMMFLKINEYSVLTLELFWGLWLFPLGLLVYHSKFIPRVLGIWLLVNGVAYVLLSFTSLVTPSFKDLVFNIGMPAMFGELALVLWLLIKGVNSKLTSNPVQPVEI